VLVSIISLFIENRAAQFRKLATKEKEQGQGFGSQHIAHVIAIGESKKAAKIWCNARLKKQFFIRNLVFKKPTKPTPKAELISRF
jgi:hypothetical protein